MWEHIVSSGPALPSFYPTDRYLLADSLKGHTKPVSRPRFPIVSLCPPLRDPSHSDLLASNPNCYLFLAPHSVTSHWWLEVDHRMSIYTQEISKCYSPWCVPVRDLVSEWSLAHHCLPFSSTSWTQNLIHQWPSLSLIRKLPFWEVKWWTPISQLITRTRAPGLVLFSCFIEKDALDPEKNLEC